ncbi:carbonic anhydrase [Aquisphaera insulae]|uniref:carbonic anhydrase n=1 Tax=Aquisphaera insulae TaxID=2712864 RepID=UPI0013EACE25|nr:carbonic anhydrase [Aquisphaera insulae]
MDITYRYDPHASVHPRPSRTAEDVIHNLQEGHLRYRTMIDRVERELVNEERQAPIVIEASPLSLGFSALGAQVQAPHALFLGCSDARAPIERIFDQPSNGIFVVRVAGNVLGTECLGSIHYAVMNLRSSLRLLVVLGHTACGAVSAAVDSYLSPHDYPEIGYTFALRSLVDRLHIAVRGAARSLARVCGVDVKQHPEYRAALIDTAVYLNAALTAFDVSSEINAIRGAHVRVVYGVFDLADQHVRALPVDSQESNEKIFGEFPASSDAFTELGDLIASSLKEAGRI